ncbi:MAG: hypothetical protein MRERC_9c023 [Mycoplasmataceae bacterium RC_NB112A]|nr:MAG: hypothetical protein MRERC_9c023 [Mycoplasmataceae bacterium RC_NB112A]
MKNSLLCFITDEGRRVYKFHAVINQRKIAEIHKSVYKKANYTC